MYIIESLKTKIRGSINLPKLIKDGLTVGENFHVQEGVIIDPGHCWLIEIGNNVTLAPRVHILAHDASTKNILGYTKINNVSIGDNVFIGAGTIVLPGVKISSNVIIGAGSIVTSDLDSGVWAGNPAKKVCSYEEYVNKNKVKMKKVKCYGEEYSYKRISIKMKKKMKEELYFMDGGYII